MSGQLSQIDYAIVVAYLLGTVFIGVKLGSGVKAGKDLFLAGRTLPWWAIGFSLVASDIGGTDIIGVGGAAYTHGMSVANFEWLGCVPAMIIAAFIFIPIFWRAGVYTIPEFMEKRFDVRIRTALAICWVIFMACNLGIMLFASAKMLHAVFGWNSTACILLTASLVGIYTIIGGLAAVVYTDVIQCVVMIAGCLAILVIGLVDLGGIGPMLEKIRAVQNIPPEQALEHAQLILPVDTKGPFPWPAILFGLGFVLGPAYWIGNQAIVQRSLGAKSEFEAKASYVWGALLKNLIPLIIAVPGLIALAKFPELKSGDDAFPNLVAHVLPVGLRGLFLAAFIAALMSSVDSYLNSGATMITNDFYQRFINRDASDAQILRIGRGITVALIIWAIGFAFYISRLEGSGIYTIFQTLMAFFQGPALAVLLTGMFWKRATPTGAFVGFLGGIACSVTLFAFSQESVIQSLAWRPLFQIAEPFLYFSVWAFITAFALIVGVSLFTKPRAAEEIKGLMFERRKSP